MTMSIRPFQQFIYIYIMGPSWWASHGQPYCAAIWQHIGSLYMQLHIRGVAPFTIPSHTRNFGPPCLPNYTPVWRVVTSPILFLLPTTNPVPGLTLSPLWLAGKWPWKARFLDHASAAVTLERHLRCTAGPSAMKPPTINAFQQGLSIATSPGSRCGPHPRRRCRFLPAIKALTTAISYHSSAKHRHASHLSTHHRGRRHLLCVGK